MTLHILDADNGIFIGAAELHDDGIIDLWSEDGNVDTYMFVHGMSGEKLYAEIVDRFAFESGVNPDDLYLTDDDESEILY